MKAALMFNDSDWPRYSDVEDPMLNGEEECMLFVKAAALKHVDRSIASGRHYSSEITRKPGIMGGDAVGLLEDGRRVFAFGHAMMAEKAVVEKRRLIAVPEGLGDPIAAALPNALAGSSMALRFRAALKPGETVLINGATGFTGKIAAQVARHYGAGRIIVSGRNEQSLGSLLELGADEILPLCQSDEDILDRLKAIQRNTPVDVVIDYLWGHTAELILASFKGNGSFTHRTRFVSVGAMTGEYIQLSAENLRSTDLHVTGSGLGSWTKEQIHVLIAEIIPEMFQLAVQGKLIADTVTVNLRDIDKLRELDLAGGKRLVVLL